MHSSTEEQVAIVASFTPLERSYFQDLCERGWTRTDEGGLGDTILSGLCSKPSSERAVVSWEMNQDERSYEWSNKYLPTAFGLEVYSFMKGSQNA